MCTNSAVNMETTMGQEFQRFYNPHNLSEWRSVSVSLDIENGVFTSQAAHAPHKS
jgi:hypothetical protein